MFGADYAIGPWVVGLPLSHSRGERQLGFVPDRGDGSMASSLTGLYPYAGFDHHRASVPVGNGRLRTRAT